MSKSSNGIKFPAILFLIFLFLKLAGIGVVSTWSWWWVTSPLWIAPALLLTIAFIIFIIAITILGLTSDEIKTKAENFIKKLEKKDTKSD